MSLPIFQIKRRNKDTALENSTGGKLNGLIEGELGYNYYDNSLWIGPYNGTTSDFSILVNENHQLTNSKWTNGTTTGPQLSLYQYDSRSQKGSWLNVGAIPSASEAQSGIVTVAAQNFKGVKTFKDGLIITNAAGTSNVAKIDNSGYIEGTRLKTTSATELTSANKIAVIENGWIYYITPSNLITNISLAGSGLTQTGTTINHTNGIKEGTISGSSGEIAHGNAINIPKITYNNTGHITGVTTTSVTLPNETPLSLSTTTGTQLTPTHGGTFDVITGITKGSGNYDLNITTQAVKLPALNGAVTSIATANLTTNRALISNSAGKVAVSDISVNELNCLDGVTSNIQTQLDAKSDAKRWSCPTQVNAYSRVCKLKDYGTGILTVMYDQNSQAVVHSYMVGTSYTMAALYQIGSSGYSVYSNQIVRIVQGSSATEFIVEIQNKFGYNGATSVTAHLTYIPLTNNTTCTPYTVYTATSSSATELAIIESRYRGIVAPNFYGHATSATQAHQIIDSGDNTKQITLNYSATEISDPTYLAGWNGYELRGVKRTDLTVGKASLLEVADTRSVNETPTELVNANGMGIRVDFKQVSTVGLSNGTYAAVMNIIPWTDAANWSGGKNTQLGFTDDGRIQVRKGNGSGWDSWKTIAYTDALDSKFTAYGYTGAVDLNTLKTNGSYYISSNATNTPQPYSELLVMRNGDTTGQLIIPYTASAYMQYRGASDGNGFYAWRTLLDSANYSSYALPKSGGEMTGAITFNSTAASLSTTTPMSISYGRIASYSSIYINANSDDSTEDEQIILTAKHGLSSDPTHGLAIGPSTLKWQGKDVATTSYVNSNYTIKNNVKYVDLKTTSALTYTVEYGYNYVFTNSLNPYPFPLITIDIPVDYCGSVFVDTSVWQNYAFTNHDQYICWVNTSDGGYFNQAYGNLFIFTGAAGYLAMSTGVPK